MKKILALLLAAVMCLALFSACGKKEDETNPVNLSEVNKELNDITVASIGGINISQAYYNLVYSQQFFGGAQYYSDLEWLETKDEQGKNGLDYLKEQTILTIEQRTAARVVAEKNGVTLTEDMKKRAQDEVAQFFQSSNEEFLKESHTTEAAMLYYQEEQYLIDALIEKLSQEGGVAQLTDEELAEAEELFKTDYSKVQHILIQTTDAQTGAVVRSDEEALKKANEVVAKLKNGANFDSLIPEYNEDPGLTQGNYYTFGPGEMVAEFENASRELKVGEYTEEPVKSNYGYHIIKKYELTTDIPEFEQYKEYMTVGKVGQIIDEELTGVEPGWKTDKTDAFISTFIKEQSEKFAAGSGVPAN